MDIQKISEANPWWSSGKVPDELKGKPRKGYDLLIKSIEIREVTILTGVRRAGKSTFMYQMVDFLLLNGISPEQILFVNFEDNRLVDSSLDDIYQSYRSSINPEKKAYIFFDEVHKRDKWESWVRRHYDLQADCKFVVSGSCSYLLKKEYATLLTGRNLTFEVYPFSFEEFLLFKGMEINISKIKKGIILEKEKHTIIHAFSEYLFQGGFPSVFFQEKDFKTKMLAQYFEDILFKDIISRYNLNSKKTQDFARYLMTNVTGLVSLRNVRNVLGLSYDLIKDYLSHFTDAFLFFTLEHFSYSMKEQKSRASKIYCVDNGLRNAVSFKFSSDEGKLAENLVFIELKKRDNEIYYWMSEKDAEVDFIVKNKDNSINAINVTYGNEISEREISSLKEFGEKFNKINKLIILTKNIEKYDGRIYFIPLWKFLLVG